MARDKCIAALILALLVGSMAAFFFIRGSEDSISNDDPPVVRTLRFSYTLTNQSQDFIENASFYSLLPLEILGIQSIDKVDSSHDYELIAGTEGVDRIKFMVGNIPPYGSRIVNLTLSLNMGNHALREKINKPLYLNHEKYIERDSAVVSRVAEGFSRDNYLRDVFVWLPANIKDIGYVAEDKGAEFALTHQWGDCTELMYAFVALARARGIPARGVAGFVMDRDSGVMRSSGYHNWAEYHDGSRWIIVDPQKQVFDSDYSQYVTYRYFGDGVEYSMSASRFLVVDKRLSVTL